MRANNYDNLLTLYEWSEILGINPYEMAQIKDGYPIGTDRHCPFVWYQRPWQWDFISRDEVARAIVQAEHDLAMKLGYWPAPKYIVNELIPYPRPANSIWYGYGLTERGQWKPIKLRWKYVQNTGVFTRTVISAGLDVAMTDRDGDNIDDHFTLTLATTVTDPDEIALYFSSANRLGQQISEAWRIRPVEVVISGGNATISGHCSLIVNPELQEGTNPQALNVNAAIFVPTVDVYQVTTDRTATDTAPNQGTAIWNEWPTSTPTGTVEYKAIQAIPQDEKLGIVKVQIPQAWPQIREPDKVNMNYLAGLPRVNGRMEPNHAMAVTYLSVVRLAGEQCGCERSQRILTRWRSLPSYGKDRIRPLAVQELISMFGPAEGALWAAEFVRDHRLNV